MDPILDEIHQQFHWRGWMHGSFIIFLDLSEILLPFFTLPAHWKGRMHVCIQIFLKEIVAISRTLYYWMVGKEKQIAHPVFSLIKFMEFCLLGCISVALHSSLQCFLSPVLFTFMNVFLPCNYLLLFQYVSFPSKDQEEKKVLCNFFYWITVKHFYPFELLRRILPNHCCF